MRLTDADTVKDVIAELNENGYDISPSDLALVRNILLRMPTIDAVPVVRCKDCKYYKESVVLSPNKFCFRMKDRYGEAAIGYNFAEDDFCSYGERRELPDAESEIDKWWERSETVNAERGEE